MSDRTERTRSERIAIDTKKIRQHVRKTGFMETKIEQLKPLKSSKYEKQDILDALEEDSFLDGTEDDFHQ